MKLLFNSRGQYERTSSEEYLIILQEEYYKAWEVQDWHWCEMVSKDIEETKEEIKKEEIKNADN